MLLLPVPLEGKMSASKFIHYFSSHKVTFGLQASLPLDNITLNAANKNIDLSPSYLQTSIGTAIHVNLETEQLISYNRILLSDNIACVQGSHGEVIPVSEVYEILLAKIHDILDSAVSKQVGTTAVGLAYVLILLPGSVMKSWLHSSLIFTVLRTLLLLVSLSLWLH